MTFPVPLPDELSAGRFSLRLLDEADGWRVEQALSREADVVRWTFYPPDLTEDAARDRVRVTRERAAAGQGVRYVVREGDEVLGTAGTAIGADGEPGVFYALLPAGRGRGAATEATRALAAWVLEVAGLPRVQLFTLPGNDASEAVARRAGFRLDGSEPGTHHGEDVTLRRWVLDR